MITCCYGCEDRKVGCHSKCQKYKDEKAKHDAQKEEIERLRYLEGLKSNKKKARRENIYKTK